jgi:hypothetical protein
VTSGVKKNLFQYSTDLTNAFWVNYNETAVLTNATLAPDGTNTAFLVTSTGTYPNTRPGQNLTVIPKTYYTLSAYVKYGNTAQCTIGNEGGLGSSAIASFDLTNGTNTNLAYNASDPIIKDVGNGWWRISITIYNDVYTYMDPEPFRIGSYSGQSAGEYMYCWGPQLELGTTATMYVPTGTNAVPVPTFAQRTEFTGNVYVSGNYDEVSGILPVTDNLTLNFDPTYSQSYPGTGTTMYDIGGNTATATWSSTVRLVSNFQNTPTEYLQFYGNGAVTTNYVQPATTSADSFTWNVWFRATQNSAGEIIIGNRNSPGLDFCKLTTIAWEFYPTILTVVAPLNIWQNVTLVKNGTTLSYYRNATLVTTSTTSASKIANPFYIGGDSSYGEISTARIGQVQIYNRALTLAEITQVFNTFRIRYGI